MKPETLGPIIEALNDVIWKFMALVMDDSVEIDAKLADAIVLQYVALIQLRNKLVDAATSPD